MIGSIETEGGEGIFEVQTESPDQTLRLGKVLGEMLAAGDVVALMGDLGAGKTILAKGIAKGLGVEDEREVTSPSFVLVNEYQGWAPVYHVDLYRLQDSGELQDLGWEEFTSGSAVVLVEWAEKALRLLPEKRIEVRLQWVSAGQRKLSFVGRGRAAKNLVSRLSKQWSKEE